MMKDGYFTEQQTANLKARLGINHSRKKPVSGEGKTQLQWKQHFAYKVTARQSTHPFIRRLVNWINHWNQLHISLHNPPTGTMPPLSFTSDRIQRASSLIFLLSILLPLAVLPAEAKYVVPFKKNIDTVFRDWNCNQPKPRLIYLGKYQLAFQSIQGSWIMYSVNCCVWWLQKTNTTTTTRAPFIYRTRWSFLDATSQSDAAIPVRPALR